MLLSRLPALPQHIKISSHAQPEGTLMSFLSQQISRQQSWKKRQQQKKKGEKKWNIVKQLAFLVITFFFGFFFWGPIRKRLPWVCVCLSSQVVKPRHLVLAQCTNMLPAERCSGGVPSALAQVCLPSMATDPQHPSTPQGRSRTPNGGRLGVRRWDDWEICSDVLD